MSRKIIYIINPVSGTRKKESLQHLIEKKTAEEKIPFEIFPSVASGDYSFLKEIITEKNITDVVIAGGDGTVNQVVGSLLGSKINFGIIPVGSGNGLALTAKIPARPRSAIRNIFHGTASPVDGFLINGRFACMLAGLGLDAEVVKEFADAPRRGLVTYIRLSVKKFFSVTPYHFILKMNDHAVETDAFFISIANSNQFGNNFTIAPKARLSDGLLDVVIVTAQNKVSMILQTIKQVAGWNKIETDSLVKNKKGVIYFQTSHLKIQNLSPAPLHVDGEPAETENEIDILIKNKCYNLIQPV